MKYRAHPKIRRPKPYQLTFAFFGRFGRFSTMTLKLATGAWPPMAYTNYTTMPPLGLVP